MKVVLLAGGLGTRLSEETGIRPKPMVEIGGLPILVHIMKWYMKWGFNDFIVCCGYKGEVIKEYFYSRLTYLRDASYDFRNALNKVSFHPNNDLEFKVTCVDTGQNTMTGGRINKIIPYLEDETEFLLTYGDGVGNIDIGAVINHHRNTDALVTISVAKNPSRFGIVDIGPDGLVRSFEEKPEDSEQWVNIGYSVVNTSVLSGGLSDSCVWERSVLPALIPTRYLAAYKHTGFWKPMDTLKDKTELEELYRAKGNIYGE